MKNVLLATDGSKLSIEAAQLLAHLPHEGKVALTVQSVVQRPFIHSNYATGELLEKAFQRDRAFAESAFRRVADMFDGANVSIRHVVSEGSIGESIVDLAAEIEADLVVMGARGHSPISRMLLGSISDHVATHAPCSTLVVRPTSLQEIMRPIRVCLAYESSQSAIAALEEIAEIPWRTGTDFHVISIETYLSDFIGQRIAEDDLDLSSHFQEALLLAKERLVDVAPNAQTHLIKSDHVGEGLVTFAESNEIDLMVIGETPRSALNRFLLGSTSRYVLRHAPCSVWLTRNRVPEKRVDQPSEDETDEMPPRGLRHQATRA
ncbi:MAG: universal stress protein [Planctomycetota bacterium]